MGTRLFVGGLTYRVRERDLEKFFRKFGRIKVSMKNGFAFVVSLIKCYCFFLQYGRDKGLCRWASIWHQGKRPSEIFQRLWSFPRCSHQEWLWFCCKYQKKNALGHFLKTGNATILSIVDNFNFQLCFQLRF